MSDPRASVHTGTHASDGIGEAKVSVANRTAVQILSCLSKRGPSSSEHPLCARLGCPEARQGLAVARVTGAQCFKKFIDDQHQQLLHGSPLYEGLRKLESCVGLGRKADEYLLSLALHRTRHRPARLLPSRNSDEIRCINVAHLSDLYQSDLLVGSVGRSCARSRRPHCWEIETTE